MQVVLPAMAHGKAYVWAARLTLLEIIEQTAHATVKLCACMWIATVRSTATGCNYHAVVMCNKALETTRTTLDNMECRLADSLLMTQ